MLFVAVATDPGRIPPLLQERLEALPLAGYTDAEKQRIATGHLVPQRRRQHGLSADELSFSPAALQLLISGYSREPGVHVLDDGIDGLCRRAARLRAEGLPLPGEMGPEAVSTWLGAPRFRDDEIAARTRRPGVALGLAATGEGGDVLLVEAACLPGRGTLRVTRTVGPMTRESANVAMTWVRSHAERLAGAARFDDTTDVHVHLAEAARWKDGPSAGVALAVALVSALTGQPVRGDAAMSGELTLAGTVEPVGGIREKVLGACRARLAAVPGPPAASTAFPIRLSLGPVERSCSSASPAAPEPAGLEVGVDGGRPPGDGTRTLVPRGFLAAGGVKDRGEDRGAGRSRATFSDSTSTGAGGARGGRRRAMSAAPAGFAPRAATARQLRRGTEPGPSGGVISATRVAGGGRRTAPGRTGSRGARSRTRAGAADERSSSKGRGRSIRQEPLGCRRSTAP